MNILYEAPVVELEEYQHYMNIAFDKCKYMHMWYLRHLEKEIDESGGMLILKMIDGSIKLHMKQMPESLISKIELALDEMDKDVKKH